LIFPGQGAFFILSDNFQREASDSKWVERAAPREARDDDDDAAPKAMDRNQAPEPALDDERSQKSLPTPVESRKAKRSFIEPNHNFSLMILLNADPLG
jgi:hypothetical protein